MPSHSLFGFRKKHEQGPRMADKRSPAGNGHAVAARQPFSDGSEEFFEEFTRREEGTRHHEQAGILMGLGLALGLFLGVGTILLVRHGKVKLSKHRRWFDW